MGVDAETDFLNGGDSVYEIACGQLAAMDEAQRAVLDRKVEAEAARGLHGKLVIDI